MKNRKWKVQQPWPILRGWNRKQWSVIRLHCLLELSTFPVFDIAQPPCCPVKVMGYFDLRKPNITLLDLPYECSGDIGYARVLVQCTCAGICTVYNYMYNFTFPLILYGADRFPTFSQKPMRVLAITPRYTECITSTTAPLLRSKCLWAASTLAPFTPFSCISNVCAIKNHVGLLHVIYNSLGLYSARPACNWQLCLHAFEQRWTYSRASYDAGVSLL